MSSPEQKILDCLKDQGITWALSVPCKGLAGLLDLLATDQEIKHLPVTREEEGVGIAAGLFLGGQLPVLLMQNSGLGNCLNALMSLTRLYRLSLVMLISHRGLPGEPIVAQTPMGRITADLLDLAGIHHSEFRSAADLARLPGLIGYARVSQRPVAALIRPSFWRTS